MDTSTPFTHPPETYSVDRLRNEVARLRVRVSELESAHLGDTHTGLKISASGILGRIATGRYFDGLDFGCGEMLRHLEQMAARFYAGEVKAVDEFLQLYDLAGARPGEPGS